MINKITLVGRLGADPTISESEGTPVARFRLATWNRWTDKDGVQQERTEWHSCFLWGKKALVAGEYLAKGMLVYVEGKMEYRSLEDGRRFADVRVKDFQMLDKRPSE